MKGDAKMKAIFFVLGSCLVVALVFAAGAILLVGLALVQPRAKAAIA